MREVRIAASLLPPESVNVPTADIVAASLARLVSLVARVAVLATSETEG